MDFFIIIFILGLIIGSFLNVLIYRLPRNISLLGRSFCPQCKKAIHWYDNIPLLSFMVLRGRCRSCHSPISWQYPTVELLTAALFVVTVIFSPSPFAWGYTLFIVSVLIVVFFTDLNDGMIPDVVIFPSIAISFAYFLISNLLSIEYLLSALGASLFFFLIVLLTSGRGMGFGDVKLVVLLGFFLGWPQILLALYISFLTGGLISAILLLGRVKKIGQTIPFGPFLVGGALIALFFGDTILRIFV